MTDPSNKIASGRSRRALKWLLYLFGVALFVALGLEGLLRVTYADPDYYWDNRFLFIFRNAYLNREGHFWTYRPEAKIREAAVYAVRAPFTTQLRMVVEYDCGMRSNNLGLLQADNIERGASATVILGDSFTAGEGGCPWFDRLQERRKSDRLINAALPGHGFGHWVRLIEYLRKSGVQVRRLLIVGISSDFPRTPWIWTQEQLECLNRGPCPKEDLPGLWHPLEPDESHASLIERSAARYGARYARFGESSWGEALKDYMRQESYFVKFIAIARDRILKRNPSAQGANSFSEADNALQRFKSLGIPLHVLMVSQRDEVGLLGNRKALNAATALLDSHGVAHSWCGLSKSHFLPFDGHPNRAGYDKLLDCVDRALSNLE